jgi:hypothetical protein
MKGMIGGVKRGGSDSQIFPTISVDEWLTDRFNAVVVEADAVSDPFLTTDVH